jgi:hypothetical protein
MKLSNFVEGLQILSRYAGDDTYPLGAEHDIFYFYASGRPMKEEDVKKMVELDWFQEAYEGDEFKPEDYDSEESWCAWV